MNLGVIDMTYMPPLKYIKWHFTVKFPKTQKMLSKIKEVCNAGVACSLLKLGSLKKTVIASLFHSGLHSGTFFYGKNDVICHSGERQFLPF